MGALAPYPDPEAVHALRRITRNVPTGGRILLIEHTFDIDRLDEHDGEADLIVLTRDCTGLRTAVELDAVIAAAGLTVARTESIGWGGTLRILC